MDQTTQLIHRALQTLAGYCDGAQSKDECGYNAFDTAFGKELASKAELTQGQARAAFAMLRKYKKQLSNYGIVLPESLPGETVKGAWAESGLIYLTFNDIPSKDTRTWIKSISGWRWNPDRKDAAWTVPFNPQNMQAVSERFACEVEIKAAPVTEPAKKQIQDVRIELKKQDILVYFPNQYGRKERVETLKTDVPDRKWLPDEPESPWLVPGRFADKVYNLFPTAQGAELLKEMSERTSKLREMSNKADGSSLKNIPGLQKEPLPFQYVGVEFIDTAQGRALIGDDMGLGKTVQALAYLQLHLEDRPALIVCPNSIKANWLRHVYDWMEGAKFGQRPENRTIILKGKPVDIALTGAKIAIINYDILKKWSEVIKKWSPKIVILDEAHACKNREAQRTVAAKAIAKAAPKLILLTVDHHAIRSIFLL